MKPLIVLFGIFILVLLFIKIFNRKYNNYFGTHSTYHLAGRIALSSMLIFTAIGHFIYTEGMAMMLPHFLPEKKVLVYGSGLLEIAFAIGLLIPRTRRFTGWLLILFFICVLPLNINAAMHKINYQTARFDGPGMDYIWFFRLPVQILFILWVYISAIKDEKMSVTK